MIKLKHLIQKKLFFEGYFHKNKQWIMYEGHSNIVIVFDDNTKLQFELDFHGHARHNNNSSWKRKACSTWKRLAKEIHDNIEITEVGNKIQKSWKQSFAEAMQHSTLKPFIKPSNKIGIFDNKATIQKSKKNTTCMDPINFTPRI